MHEPAAGRVIVAEDDDGVGKAWMIGALAPDEETAALEPFEGSMAPDDRAGRQEGVGRLRLPLADQRLQMGKHGMSHGFLHIGAPLSALYRLLAGSASCWSLAACNVLAPRRAPCKDLHR